MDNQEKKKSKKGKIIAIVVVVLVVIIAAFCWFSGLVGGISEAEAKEIAYNQVSGAEQLDNAIVAKEFDDFRMVYEIQFNHENVFYEFQIAARNGKIIEQDTDSVTTNPQGNQDQSQSGAGDAQQDAQAAQSDIGIEAAKEIALSQVSGASASDITKAKADSEHGKLVYEIEIQYDGQEYDFDIDAATGNIVGSSQESVLH